MEGMNNNPCSSEVMVHSLAPSVNCGCLAMVEAAADANPRIVMQKALRDCLVANAVHARMPRTHWLFQ